MGFDFFKKKGGGKKRNDDLFDPMDDAPEFDELEDSSEFLSGESYVPPPDPAPHRASPPPRHAAPPPRPYSPPPPSAPPSSAPLRPAPPPRPAVDPDLTMLNRPPIRPAAPLAPATAGAVPPAAPIRPGPQAPPAPMAPAPPAPMARPVAPPPRPQAPPPPLDDDRTQIMAMPVGAATVVAWLVVAAGANKGQDFRLPGGMVRIGRESGNDIVVDFDTAISGWHAEISFQDGEYVARDLDSSNGSFVNEARITEASLRDNDRVRLGQTVFVFKSLSL